MKINTDQLYTDMLKYRDELEDSLRLLDRDSASYKVLLVALDKVNAILHKCKKSLNLKDKK